MESEVKIPTLFGLGILITGLIAGVYLVTRAQNFVTRASPQTTPKNIQVVNLSDTSVSIYWQTDVMVNGFIEAGPNLGTKKSYSDDRDTFGPEQHKLHFVTLRSLKPDTTYNFRIISGSSFYPFSSDLSFSTTPAISTKPTPQPPLIGTVFDRNMQPVREALVFLDIPGSQPLATITKSSGAFILPLSGILAFDLQKEFIFSATGNESFIKATDFQTDATVRFTLSKTDAQSSLVLVMGTSGKINPKEASSSTPGIRN